MWFKARKNILLKLKKILAFFESVLYNIFRHMTMAHRQMVRHWTLTPAFQGSNPCGPANKPPSDSDGGSCVIIEMRMDMRYEWNTRVGYSDVGQDGKMSYGNSVDMLQNCSNFQSLDIGVGLDYLIENRKAWLLSYWQIEFVKPMSMGDNIKVSTWAYDFDKIFGYRNFAIQNNQGEYTVKANSIWFLVNLDTFKPMRLKEEDVSAYGLESKLDMEYGNRRVKLPEDMEEIDRIKVRNYHIDTNGHVNNAWYIKIAMEYIEKSVTVRQIRVEYKHSAVYGDEITVKKQGNVIAMYNAEGDIYAVVEYEEA